jgi:hypothetical protein
MSSTPTISEATIRNWTDEGSFSRGQSYFRNGAIIYPRREGNILKAHCHGSRVEPYRVQIILGNGVILGGHCSCPIGSGGRCKHAVALLLTWLDDPEAFTEQVDLDSRLQERSKEELVALVHKMIERHPDLELLLELPKPAPAGDEPLSPVLIQEQVEGAFQAMGWDRRGWVDGIETAIQLRDLVELGSGYEQQANWPDAVTIYETIIRETLERYDQIDDEGGELGLVINECVSGLGNCLAAADQADLRQRILRALFDTYRWDVEFGGIGIGDEAPDLILEHATEAERQMVAGWVQEALPAGESWSNNYKRQVYGGLLLELQGNKLDDEAFLAMCRQTGRLFDLVERLLSLNRLDEAAAEARQAPDYDLLNLAPLFISHGQGELIEQIVRERLSNKADLRLVVWLRDRLAGRGNTVGALRLQEQLFWQGYPSLAEYQKLKALAEPMDRWPEVREGLLARLAEQGQYSLLIEIYLQENEVEAALAALERSSQDRYGVGPEMASRVAQAVEAGYPDKAIDIYLKWARWLISGRSRGSYAQAAQLLGRVRAIYERFGRPESWQALIKSIRNEHRKLPALQDELKRAGL